MQAWNLDSPDCTIRNALRLHTRDVHQQLHEHSHFVALFEGTITQPQYLALMKSFHGFYAPLELAIERALSRLTSDADKFSYVKRVGFLVNDMSDLGYRSADIDKNPQCLQLADIVTPASLGGVLYVIEGSTLGAAQIDRAAQKILRSDTPHGRSFWAWSRANNKGQWAAINAYLDHLQDTGHSQAAIVQGANDTFEALATWLAPLDEPVLVAESVTS